MPKKTKVDSSSRINLKKLKDANSKLKAELSKAKKALGSQKAEFKKDLATKISAARESALQQALATFEKKQAEREKALNVALANFDKTWSKKQAPKAKKRSKVKKKAA